MENEAYILAESLGLELLPQEGTFSWQVRCIDGRSNFHNEYQSVVHVLYDLENYGKALIGMRKSSAIRRSV